MIKLKKYLNRPTYAVDRPWTLALLNATTIGLILAIFEPFHYRLNSINLEYYVFLSGLHSLLPF